MAIVDPGVINFSNTTFRPMCEKFRNLKAEIDALLITFNSVHAVNCPDDAGETLSDGRVDEGVSVLNGHEINTVINYFTQFKSMMDGVNVSTNISKPCVRPLNVVY